MKKYEDFEAGGILKYSFPHGEREDWRAAEKRERHIDILNEYAGLLESRLLFGDPESRTWVKPRWMQTYDKLAECSGDGSRLMEHIVEGVCKIARQLNKQDVIEMCAAQLVKNADYAIRNGQYRSSLSSACQLWDCAFNYCEPGSDGRNKLIDAWKASITASAVHDLKGADAEIDWVWARRARGGDGAAEPEMVEMVKCVREKLGLEPERGGKNKFRVKAAGEDLG